MYGDIAEGLFAGPVTYVEKWTLTWRTTTKSEAD